MSKQYAGLILSPDWIRTPGAARPFVRDVADDGYAALILFVRHTQATVLDRRVHDAVRSIVRMGQRLGLKVLLDDDPKWWGEVCAERHPAAALQVIHAVETDVAEGAFEARVPFPRMGKGQTLCDGVAAAFNVRDGHYQALPESSIHADCANQGSRPRWEVLVRGTVAGNYRGRLVLYVAFRCFGWADLAHPRYLAMQRELVDAYGDVHLDGFSWDEPGGGKPTVAGYKSGEGFERLFHRISGYELRPNLIHLDHGDGTERAVLVRYDYYRALAEMHVRAQRAHNTHARKRASRPLAFGTHHTWSGIPLDLGNGAMDYFRSGQVLTAAWTDGSWDALPRNLVFHLMLADGLRKELGLRDAYYNDWTATLPAVENMRFATRCKMLFRVNWFNIFFSRFTEGEASPLSEPLRTESRREAANLDRLDAFLGEALRPRGDVALLYAWEGIATAPLRTSRAYYAALQNAALCLTDRNIATDIISPASLERGRIADGRCFAVNGQRYRMVVVPYPHALPEATYARLSALAEAGVPVAVFGLPPEFTLGPGVANCVRDAFAEQVGFKPFTQAEFLAAAAAQGRLPGAEEWEPGWLDAVFPAVPTTGRATFDREGRPLHVRAPDRPLYYLPALDPRDDLCNLVAQCVGPGVDAFAERTYFRFFANQDDGRDLALVLAAKGHVAGDVCETDEAIARFGGKRQSVKDSSMKALFRMPQGTLTACGGSWCAVRLRDGVPEAVLGDGAEVLWNGAAVPSAAMDKDKDGHA